MKLTLPLAITVSLLSSIAFASPAPVVVGSTTERHLARNDNSIPHDVARSIAGAFHASGMNAVKRQEDASSSGDSSTDDGSDDTSGDDGTTDDGTTDDGTADSGTTDDGTTDDGSDSSDGTTTDDGTDDGTEDSTTTDDGTE